MFLWRSLWFAAVVCGCGARSGNPATVGSEPGGVHWSAFASLPTEPLGPECLADQHVASVVSSLRGVDPKAPLPRLVGASCSKRQYVDNSHRYVVWGRPNQLRARRTSLDALLPTSGCIERGLVVARDVIRPAGAVILQRAAQQDPDLWRDPDIGAAAYLKCDRFDRPDTESLATMLHETVHRLGGVACVFEFENDRRRCFLDEGELPPATIARFRAPPKHLDADAVRWFEHLQHTYLDPDGANIRSLLDEVTAYRIEAELEATGRIRNSYVNLPMLMALAVRYLDIVAAGPGPVFLKSFRKTGANGAIATELLDLGERAYQKLSASGRAGVFERGLWDEYRRTRAQWEGR